LGDLYSPGLVTATAAALLGILAIYAFAKGLISLNNLANKSAAFNLSAIAAVVVAFGTFNVQQLVGGDFDWPHFDAPADDEAFRKLLGLFVLVQGFESSRYIGAYFSAEERVKTMRSAQYISSAVYVLFVAFSLILFATVVAPNNVTAIFEVSKRQPVIGDRGRHSDPVRDAGRAARRSVAQAVDLPAVPGPGDSRRPAHRRELGGSAGLSGVRRLLPLAGVDRRAARLAGREMGLGRLLRRHRVGDGGSRSLRASDLRRAVASRLTHGFDPGRITDNGARLRARADARLLRVHVRRAPQVAVTNSPGSNRIT
jgi:hypothetical protein